MKEKETISSILQKTFQRDTHHPYCTLKIQEREKIIFICKFNINESRILFEAMPIAKGIRKGDLNDLFEEKKDNLKESWMMKV